MIDRTKGDGFKQDNLTIFVDGQNTVGVGLVVIVKLDLTSWCVDLKLLKRSLDILTGGFRYRLDQPADYGRSVWIMA